MLKDESEKQVDPVSGNEIPVGSTAEEVRDDVDAKLSVGEFVLPADVVRYIGLNNIMKLRDAAKAGLARMEQQGQMGNGDEQVVEGHDMDMESMIDTMSKGESDDTVQAFAYGGTVMPTQFAPRQRAQAVYQAPQIPVMPTQPQGVPAPQPIQAASAQYVRPTVGNTGAMQSSQYTPVMVPATATTPMGVQAAPTGAPTPTGQPEGEFQPNPDYALPNIPGEVEEVIYVGPNGEEVVIRFKGTVPLDPIPVGYVRKDTIKPEVEKPEIEAPEIEAPEVEAIRTINNSGDSGEGVQDDGPATLNQRKTDTRIALAQLIAKDNPELQAELKNYTEKFNSLDMTNLSFGEMIGKIISRAGIFGIIRTVAENVSLNNSKEAIADAIADVNVGVNADLLRQWSTSQRPPEEILNVAQQAYQQGASQSLALAMAIDDRFDSDSLQGLGSKDLSEWEQVVADMYGVTRGSSQAVTLAKEELDMFNGNVKDALAFYKDSDPLSEAQRDQIAERETLQAEMDKLGLGSISGMTAREAQSQIDAEIAKQERLAEIARKEAAEAARKAALAEEQRKAEAAAAEAARQRASQSETSGSGSGSSSDPYTPGWSASDTSTWDTSGGGTGPGGSYDISSWFSGAKGGMVNRKHNKTEKELKEATKKRKRKTSL